MSNSHATLKDKLNFILGNDVGELFVTDGDVAPVREEDGDLTILSDVASAAADLAARPPFAAFAFANAVPTPASSAAANASASAPAAPNEPLRSFAKSPPAAFTAADYEMMNEDFARDDGSEDRDEIVEVENESSPSFAAADRARRPLSSRGANPFRESLATNDASDQLEKGFQDFNFVGVDDVHILAALRAAINDFKNGLRGPQANNDFNNGLREPLVNLGPDPHNYPRYYHLGFLLQEGFSLPLTPSLLTPPPPCSFVASNDNYSPAAAAAASVFNVPPRKRGAEDITPSADLAYKLLPGLPAHLDLRPLILQGPVDPYADEVRAAEARLVRRKRRRLRAKSQAVNLVCGGDVSEVRRRAVLDSDLTANDEPNILADVARCFDPETYVDITFEQVYQSMVEMSQAKVETVSSSAKGSDGKPPGHTPGPGLMQAPSDSTASSAVSKKTRQKATKTRATKEGSAGAGGAAESQEEEESALPQGRDPESRKLRQRMRNRLSAQRSRDRRKKAMEDAQELKEAKEQEIKALEEKLSQQTKQMMLLERMVCFAREHLGADHVSKVASTAG